MTDQYLYSLIWVILMILVTIYGHNKKNIGLSTFFISLIASPLVGFIYVLARDTAKVPDSKPYKQFLEKAKREVYKENYAEAIDDYTKAISILENSYKSSEKRDDFILKLKSKVNDLESKVNLH